MGKRQRRWAASARDELFLILGGCCAQCNHRGSKKNPIEFDCIIPQSDYHHRIEWSHRISFYRAQLRQHNLQLLCRKCNNAKSHKDRLYLDSLSAQQPF